MVTISGRLLAKQLGYSCALLDKLDRAHFPWDMIFPCGCTVKYLKLCNDKVILNLGSGIGLDGFFVHLETLPKKLSVMVINMDVVHHVLKKGMLWAQKNADLLDNNSINWVCGNGLELPFKKETFTDVLLNGTFNLFEDKKILLEEIWRVLKPGGTVIVADIFTSEKLPSYFDENLDAWAWDLAGALPVEKVTEICEKAGFHQVELLDKRKITSSFYTAILWFWK